MIPHEIDAKTEAQLDENLEHLAQIGRITVGVEKRGRRFWVLDVDGDDFVASPSPELQNVDAVPPGDLRYAQSAAAGLVSDHRVRRRTRWEEGELSGNRRRDTAHIRSRGFGFIKPLSFYLEISLQKGFFREREREREREKSRDRKRAES